MNVIFFFRLSRRKAKKKINLPSDENGSYSLNFIWKLRKKSCPSCISCLIINCFQVEFFARMAAPRAPTISGFSGT